MNKVMNFLNNAVNTVKQQIDEKRRKDAADEAWVESRPESQIISNYFRQFFDKNQPGYQFSKRIHRPIWIKVLEILPENHSDTTTVLKEDLAMSSSDYNRYLAAIKAANDDADYLIRQFRYHV